MQFVDFHNSFEYALQILLRVNDGGNGDNYINNDEDDVMMMATIYSSHNQWTFRL